MKLVKPSIELKEQFLELEQDWKSNNETMIPFHWLDTANFPDFVKKTNECSTMRPKKFRKTHNFLVNKPLQ